MIIRKRSKPLPLQKLEAALPRLTQHHPRIQDITYEFNKLRKGYIGERQVDYHLEQLPSKYTILHDVYLKPPKRKSFQIDSLICTNNALYIIESKNFNDKIIFNTIHNQFTRISNGIEKGYRNPITQAESAKRKLIDWLHDYDLHEIPVCCLIAISEPSTIISVVGDDEEVARVVSHAEYIPQKITQFEEHIVKGEQDKWNGRKIGHLILQECEEFDYDILGKYGIKQNNIRAGVICAECNMIGMQRGHGVWICERCNNKSKYAHISAIADYFRLGNKWITNRECINFLRIKSKNIATQTFKSSQLIYDPLKRRWKQK